VIAVRTDKALSDTAGLRVINVDLIKSRYEGLIVPVKSLVNIDMNTMRAELHWLRQEGQLLFLSKLSEKMTILL